MNALHYVVNSSPAQKNVKKSSAGSQADFESIVFYVPIESINGGVTSTASVESSVDISSPTTSAVEFDVGFDLHPGVLLPGTPVLVDGKIMYVDSVMSPETANSVSINANSPMATRSVTANSVGMNVNSPVATRRSTANSVSTNASSPVAMSPATANSVSINANSPVGRSILSESPFHTNSSPIALSPITVNRNRAILSPEDNGSFDYNPFDKNIVTKPPVKRVAENPVATLVFFDLETTGLAHEIGKCNVQITEISMIAMNRKEFEKSQSSELKDIRLIQKVSLCTRPRASVSYGAAKVTGLNDSNLREQEPFDQNAASVITTFLSHLPKPVCLLAHNGDAYDYPLLKAEFNRLNIHLSSDILIADTLKAFRALGVPVFPPGG